MLLHEGIKLKKKLRRNESPELFILLGVAVSNRRYSFAEEIRGTLSR